ncbi:hypothetical protein B1806_11320 [Metallibacterium scheffleri]|uniref:Uncharacterized protein n=2 Tax=Metallibacterium scheffleri TaxID=993689 RepID=A0A4S3KMJ6_9GAMM|nr:hypothetical protein B1806_11320 [Metallibacterium scheffleri]
MIPAWLALVGVIVTLMVKWISDWFQRRYEFRRQLYLDLVDGVQTVNQCLGRLCDVDIKLSETSQKYQGAGPALAKVELAAPKRLSRLLTDYKNVSGACFIYLLQLRAVIEINLQDLKFADGQMEIYKEQQRYLLEELRNLSIAGSDDQARRARVEQYFDDYQEQIQKQLDRKVVDTKKIAAQTEVMSIIVTGCMGMLALMSPQILMHARKGLGFWFFDLKDYQERTKSSVVMAQQALKDLRESLKETGKSDGSIGADNID